MADCCCICGVVLATQDSNFPPWCKDIRAICWFEQQYVLSDQGSTDDDAPPFNLRMPFHGFIRFYCRRTRSPETARDFCYPFHTACWTLLQGSYNSKTLCDDVETICNIFESLYYDKISRSLRWGHNYYFEDIIDREDRQACQDEIASREAAKLADPLKFDFDKEKVSERLQKRSSVHRSLSSSAATGDCPGQLSLLPPEIFESILCHLCFRDTQSVTKTCREYYTSYGGSVLNLRSAFWESMFWGSGETAFARSLLSKGNSWKDWFFTIKSEAMDGPNRMSLRNRKRIWKLCTDLVAIIRNLKEPRRIRHGKVTSHPDRLPGPVASCLALGSSTNGCRELAEIYVPFGASQGSRICAIKPHYVIISKRRLISGLTLLLDSGRSVDAGYVCRSVNQTDSILSLRSLCLIFSRHGFEAIELDLYSTQSLPNYESSREVAIARWPIEHLKGIWLGLDAMRIVKIGLDTLEHPNFDAISWNHPYPGIPPSFYQGDIPKLHELQGRSFAPVSTLCITPENSELIGIKVYSALGPSAGVSGLGFLYNAGVEHTLGYADNASLAFFLGNGERLAKITTYKTGAFIRHLEFTTTFNRTSGRLPQLQSNSPISSEYIDYAASNDGYITVICGCFAEERLIYLGIIATNAALISQPLWSTSRRPTAALCPENNLPEMPLGGFKNHGEHRSWLQLKRKYHSVQVSINTVTSKYRPAGQVTGLLFWSGYDAPDLLGQWTGAGNIYVLGEDEQILALHFTTRKPRLVVRPGLSQVSGVTLETSQKRVDWGPSGLRELVGRRHSQQRIVEIRWDFNAFFDRLQCIWS